MQILRPHCRRPGPETLTPPPAILALASPPGDSDAHLSLRSTGLGKYGMLRDGGKSLPEVSGHDLG